jgi:hypothetical protein
MPAVESIPGKVSGAWVFRDTRLPVATVIENLGDLTLEEVMEQLDATREQWTSLTSKPSAASRRWPFSGRGRPAIWQVRRYDRGPSLRLMEQGVARGRVNPFQRGEPLRRAPIRKHSYHVAALRVSTTAQRVGARSIAHFPKPIQPAFWIVDSRTRGFHDIRECTR